ncbi:response regulator [Salinadaptatus halalkaliphilus]|uniref:Response regulator n=1 Tax=Salinadaptatus halalkaliphilus TaxID=2419781 RepID=A0A4S3TJG7_9EURY|nr:response regulator [Salinadaptatus halalkaliphilus]THE64151.1 response regulator [Salinadaptatus halalkaliphilus]
MHSSGKLTILVVEDDPNDARVVERLLIEQRQAGSSGALAEPITIDSIDHAESLRSAFDRIDEGSPDVILLDLNLPDSRGLETVERVTERAPSIPVVVLTGQTDVGIEAIRCGAQDYLLKRSITAELLSRTLRYAVERSRTQSTLRDRTQRLAVLNNIIRTDIRNDVSMIVGRSDQLRDDTSGTNAAAAESILEASHHLLEITDAAAAVMDVISGEVDDVRQPRDLNAILDDAISDCRRREDVDLVVERTLPTDRSVTVTGSAMLGSAFETLLSNATARPSRERVHITVTVSADDEHAVVEIADDGVGLTDTQQTALTDGTAIDDRVDLDAGLYLVRTVLEKIDAEIDVRDNEPSGTVTTITLERVQRSDGD